MGLGKFFNNDIVKSAPPNLPRRRQGFARQAGGDGVEPSREGSRRARLRGGRHHRRGGPGHWMGVWVRGMKVSRRPFGSEGLLQSDWMGGKGGGQPVRLGGNGAFVIGLLGKANNMKDVTGLRLSGAADGGPARGTRNKRGRKPSPCRAALRPRTAASPPRLASINTPAAGPGRAGRIFFLALHAQAGTRSSTVRAHCRGRRGKSSGAARASGQTGTWPPPGSSSRSTRRR